MVLSRFSLFYCNDRVLLRLIGFPHNSTNSYTGRSSIYPHDNFRVSKIEDSSRAVLYESASPYKKNLTYLHAFIIGKQLNTAQFAFAADHRPPFPRLVSMRDSSLDLNPSVLWRIPESFLQFDIGKWFNLQVWLRLMVRGVELNCWCSEAVASSLNSLSKLLARNSPITANPHDWPEIAVLFHYAIDSVDISSVKEGELKRHCDALKNLALALKRMKDLLDNRFAQPADFAPIAARLLEKLRLFYAPILEEISSSTARRSSDNGISDLILDDHLKWLKYSLIMAASTLECDLLQNTKPFISWAHLKALLYEDLLPISEEKFAPVPGANGCLDWPAKFFLSLGQLAAHWSVRDRNFWSAWFDRYFEKLPQKLQQSGSVKVKALRTSICLGALLNSDETDCLNLVNFEQKTQLIDEFSSNAKILKPHVIEELKVRVAKNLRLQNFDCFDQDELTRLADVLNSYEPVRVIFLECLDSPE